MMNPQTPAENLTAITITCLRCGIPGQIEGMGRNGDPEKAQVFRYRGHNPFSGDIHYQCPACGTILPVDPATVLDSLTSGHSGTATAESRETPNDRRIRNQSRLAKLFRNR